MAWYPNYQFFVLNPDSISAYPMTCIHSLMFVLNLKLLQPVTSEGGRVGAEPTFVSHCCAQNLKTGTDPTACSQGVATFLYALSLLMQNNQHPSHRHLQFVLHGFTWFKVCWFLFVRTLCVTVDDVELNLTHFSLFIV